MKTLSQMVASAEQSLARIRAIRESMTPAPRARHTVVLGAPSATRATVVVTRPMATGWSLSADELIAAEPLFRSLRAQGFDAPAAIEAVADAAIAARR